MLEEELAFFTKQEDSIKNMRSKLVQMADTVCKKDISIYDDMKCPLCKGTNFGYTCVQRRSSDEGMCTLVACRQCPYRIVRK